MKSLLYFSVLPGFLGLTLACGKSSKRDESKNSEPFQYSPIEVTLDKSVTDLGLSLVSAYFAKGDIYLDNGAVTISLKNESEKAICVPRFSFKYNNSFEPIKSLNMALDRSGQVAALYPCLGAGEVGIISNFYYPRPGDSNGVKSVVVAIFDIMDLGKDSTPPTQAPVESLLGEDGLELLVKNNAEQSMIILPSQTEVIRRDIKSGHVIIKHALSINSDQVALEAKRDMKIKINRQELVQPLEGTTLEFLVKSF